MIPHYLKTAWRNLVRNKANSFINIVGLAIGIACVVFILLYVQDELKYDRFFKHADRIYEVNIEANMGGQEFLSGTTPPPVGAALTNAFPEIETYTRVFRTSDELVRNDDKAAERFFTERRVAGADSNFLQVFDFKLLQGNAATCLLQPTSVVLTETTAKKYFGNTKALGKILLFGDDKKPFTVTGVLKDLPSQSTIQFDMLRSVSSYNAVQRFSWSWVWMQMITFVKLRDNANNDSRAIQTLETKFPAMVRQQAASAFKRIGQPFDAFIKKGGKYNLHLQPLTAIHLHSAGVGSAFTNLSDIKYVYLFSAVAVFIVLLACINFMNLATAQSALRAKEVGVRKVLGSAKSQLVRQFFIEAFLYSFLAALLAVVLMALLLKPFSHVSGKTFLLSLLFSKSYLLYVLLLVAITGLLAGSYPAFYLASFKPVAVLKGGLLRKSFANLFLRNGLVVFQFAISTALIVCTIIIYQQLQYTRHKNLGLNKDNVVMIANANRLSTGEETFRQQLTNVPGIKSASITSSVPTKDVFTDGYVPVPSGNEKTVPDISLSSFIVDENFVPTIQLQLTQGRSFSHAFSDSASVILNEEAVRQIGWKNPLGQWLKYPGNNDQQFKVIGVVKDFNVQSLHNPMIPFALFHTSSKTYDLGVSYIIARVQGGEEKKTLAALENKWKRFAPDIPFDYTFLDDEFNALYRDDIRMGAVFNVFTGLAIFIACLGLFGLAIHTAERRTKEIGIRKVLGASVESLVLLLSKDFLKLVCIAAVIAFPLAGWYMHTWLQDFAYRISISWWIFLFAGGAALVIALATVSFQAIKAAVANPVKSLRTE